MQQLSLPHTVRKCLQNSCWHWARSHCPPTHMNSIVLGVCFVSLTSDPGGVSDIILHQQNVKVAR